MRIFSSLYRWSVVWIAFGALVVGEFGQAISVSNGQQRNQSRRHVKPAMNRPANDNGEDAFDMFGGPEGFGGDDDFDGGPRGGPRGFGRGPGDSDDALMDLGGPLWFGIPSGFGEDFDKELREMWGDIDVPAPNAWLHGKTHRLINGGTLKPKT